MDSARIRRRLTELAAEYSIPGLQLAIHGDRLIRTFATGVRRHGTAEPVTDESAFPTGSITKLLTAATAMVLVADGDLHLDKPLAEQVDGLSALPERTRGQLTARHVLSHTGGLPSDPPDVRATSLRRHVEDCCRAVDPLAAPGTAFSYSNIGYLIAGHAIEDITGMTWAEAAQALVLDPLDLPGRFVVGPGRAADLVTGHAVRRDTGVARPVAQSLCPPEAPAGAWAASASDLVRLGRALAGFEPDGPLDPDALAEMRAPAPCAEPFGLADGWGIGLASYGGGALRSVGHDGTGDGTSCHLRVDPATGTAVALTANGATGFALWRELVAELPDLGVPIADYDPLPDLGDPVAPPPGCVGEYANGETTYRITHAGGGRLHAAVDGAPFADLTVYPGLRCALRDCDTGVTDQVGRFITGPNGEPAWFQVGGRLAHRGRAAVSAA
ncbi:MULTISPECIES: serine hydrolase domain-containing protein [Actinokineospora]|uniref:Serine hydrolase n=1 Tax=Actinokineospora fastidiosa TaxID=1816 RepID=A0A918LJT1_9PSEU|nr:MULTISPECIES: serine hydrolase domain-containing protein [Actinokineospora]UVS79191.1 D-alanyl-D-alanine carboxypeptidase precursor [Actinokineospora sp. UTMC 2448]GGS58590.1 serine hydrolase [Actinokineospora fastidiosa]